MKREAVSLTILAAIAAVVGVALASRGGGDQHPKRLAAAATSITQSDTWTCSGPVALDLVKVTIGAGQGNTLGIVIGKNCTGSIARIEVDTASADGLKVQNSAPVAHDLSIGGGYITCTAKAPTLHQDGVQVMGGTNILFHGLSIGCGRADDSLIDSDFFVNKAGSGATTPTDVVCDGCFFGPGPAAHEVNIGESVRSGVRNSTVCPDKTPNNGALDVGPDAVDPVRDGNTFPETCEP